MAAGSTISPTPSRIEPGTMPSAALLSSSSSSRARASAWGSSSATIAPTREATEAALEVGAGEAAGERLAQDVPGDPALRLYYRSPRGQQQGHDGDGVMDDDAVPLGEPTVLAEHEH